MNLDVPMREEIVNQIITALKNGESVRSKWVELSFRSPANQTLLIKHPLGDESITGDMDECMPKFAERMIDLTQEYKTRWAKMQDWVAERGFIS
jgi:hypothetical protein